jgi:hypothetical protein
MSGDTITAPPVDTRTAPLFASPSPKVFQKILWIDPGISSIYAFRSSSLLNFSMML